MISPQFVRRRDFGADGRHLQRRLELGDLLPQLFHLTLQLGDVARLATRTLTLRAGQSRGNSAAPSAEGFAA